MSRKIRRYDGRIDSRPCRNVPCGYAVCESSEPAVSAFELRLTEPISLVNMAAFGASPRCVSWVYQDHGNTCEFGFVRDELSQLSECPRTMAATLSLPNNRVPSNALQIFEGDCSTGVFGFSHQFLGNAMVDIGSVTGFLAGDFSQVAGCAPSAALLESGAEFGHLAPDLFYLFPAMDFAVGINGDVDNTEVYPQCSEGFDFVGFWYINNDAEIECSFDKYEVGLTSDAVEAWSMIITDEGGNDNAAIERQQRGFIQSLPTQYSLVIDHCAVRSELRLDIPVSFICFDGLGDCTDGHLCRKTELRPNLCIDEGLEFDFVSTSVLESDFADEITGGVECGHCTFEGIELPSIGAEFDFECQIHHISHILQYINTCRRFLPRLKPMGFLGDKSW